MKNISFKKVLPHLIAVAIFLIVAVIISKPAFESDTVLKQSDLAGWYGMSHQSDLYYAQHGTYPLWVTSMFSGMPAYQIKIEGSWSPLSYIDHLFQLWLPMPMNFFFLACIAFYFLCMCLKVRPFAAILGSLAFAYCSFSPIIITAGHVTQMLALGYAPALIGAAVLIFDKKYLAGFTLASLFTALQIAQGHQQISYYLFLVLGIMSIGYAIHWIKTNQTTHLLKSLGLLLVAGIAGICINAVSLFPTYDYAKESKRGGQLVMDNATKKDEKIVNGKTTGLSREYAFQWSYGRTELMTLMFPGVMAYGNHYAEREGESYMFPKLDENSHTVKYLTEKLGVPENAVDQAASQFSQSLYWGKQPFTNGPVYLGAVICFLFIFGMFYLDGKHKWWIFAASLLAMLLALGHNLAGFNYFMFDYLPLYNKFRVPTMALVIPQMLFPIIAALTLNKLLENNDPESWKKFKLGALATAVLFVIAFLFYASSDFGNENKQRTAQFNQLYNAQDPALEQKLAQADAGQPEKDNQLYEGMVANFKGSPDPQKSAREFVSALKQDRASFFMKDIVRSFIYILIAAAFIALYLKKKLNATVLLAGLTLTALVDLMSFDMKYLNEKSFDSKEKYEEQEFPMTNADREILKDTDPDYRVYNLSVGSPFEESKTSYYHKSIGGYHAAKLGIYDDLTAYQLSGAAPNIGVLNMLNTKYVIQRQGNDVVASRNPGALGNAWFVKAVQFVNGPVAEMKALTGFSPKDTAVVDEKYKALVSGYAPADSSAVIKLKTFDNDAISYESSSTTSNVAVFSEIYYKEWNAYIDGKKAPYFKANYVLRAMLVPAGKHTIAFKFEPTLFYTSKTISNVFTWLLMLLLVMCIVAEVRKNKIKAV
ncbi:MAG: YfhO family protein [Ferruginibacter sp.]